MARLLVFGNFELAIECSSDERDVEGVARAKEEQILNFLKRLTEGTGQDGSVESLEFETFIYDDGETTNPGSYYYNKYEKDADARAR